MPNVLQSMIWGSASFGYADKWSDISIGPLWFVCASTWVRILWAMLQKIKKLTIRGGVIIIFAIGAYHLKEITINPWSILSAFGALGFFFSGHVIRKYDLLTSETWMRIMPIALLSLVYCMCFSKLDINYCIYGKGYIVDVVGCIGAFMLLYAVVRKFANVKFYPWHFLNFIGRYSLVAFCFHAIDHCLNVHWFPFKFWSFFTTNLELCCALILRIGFVAIGVYVVSKNQFLRERIFFIR